MRDDAQVVDGAMLAIALAVIPIQRRYQHRILRDESCIGRHERFLEALGRDMDALLHQAREDIQREPARAAEIVNKTVEAGKKLTIALGEVA